MTTNVLVNDVVKEWGLSSLPEEKQKEMVDRLGRMMYQAILIKALDILSDKEQVELDLILDEDTTTPQDVLTFLKSKIPTFDQLMREERESLRRDLSLSQA